MTTTNAKAVGQPPKTVLIELIFRQLGKRVKVEVAHKTTLTELLPQLASTISFDLEYLKFTIRTKEGRACTGD